MSKITFTEVSLRDGLQNESIIVPTSKKIELINKVTDAGIKSIEVGSYVHPKLVPQMADIDELMESLQRLKDVKYSVLIPNLKGAERAVSSKPDEFNLLVSASDSHNLANIKKTTFETLKDQEAVVNLAYKNGINCTGGIATTFGCPFEGVIPIERVLSVIRGYVDMGVTKISLADTTGMSNPKQIRDYLRIIKTEFSVDKIKIKLHLHNTRGLGLANILVAYEEGITHFDSSLAGIGGCPFAPGASGNVCTEDVVNMFEEIGIDTNLDLDKLVDTAKLLEEILGYQLPGQLMKSGKTTRLTDIAKYTSKQK